MHEGESSFQPNTPFPVCVGYLSPCVSFGRCLLMPGQRDLVCVRWPLVVQLRALHPSHCDRYIVSHSVFCCDSVFGEDALVNVSVEKKDDNDGKLAGYIRIRSKTQGIALSLGDRITSVQRGLPEPSKQ